MEIKEIKEKKIWEDFFVGIKEKTFLQSWDWGEFQILQKSKIWRFGVYDDENLVGVALVAKVSARRGTFLFVPHGPNIISNFQFPISKNKVLEILLTKLKEIAQEEKASFIRIAPFWERDENNIKIFKDLGFRQAPIHMHAEVTWELDISITEEELLAGMRKTTRYLIRQAQKNPDIQIVKSNNIDDLDKFIPVYLETAKRHKFVVFPIKYLKNQFSAFNKDNQIQIFFGKYKGEIISVAIFVFWQNIAFYHHSGSLTKYSKIPVNYLLHWEAIKEAKKMGCEIYNFWGISPFFVDTKNVNPKSEILNPKQIRNSKFKILNKKHPWDGLTLFKMGFGGYRRELIKTQDYIISKKYWLTCLFEKLRKAKRGL
ncbi:peptidoglycan bridge formation glycyltransferase FemA/FemB family protein [Patescibacteria group bacterium]|nr:peptidoglycan bridge formation glycyltransferase FemA/FemB family protein [Patescibacteria group bacterium]